MIKMNLNDLMKFHHLILLLMNHYYLQLMNQLMMMDDIPKILFRTSLIESNIHRQGWPESTNIEGGVAKFFELKSRILQFFGGCKIF
jgi:hypothetical protein